MSDRAPMPVWVVYDHPRDYPDAFVARKFLLTGAPDPQPTSDMFAADSVEELRALLPRSLACFARSPDDDPKIVEVWM